MGPANIYPWRKMHRSRAPSIAPGTFFVAQSWADSITDMPGFDLRQAQVTVVAHSMGNWVALEALRARAIRAARVTDKIRRVFLVAPDVDVDVFRTQIARMGAARPKFALVVSQDDQALRLSQEIWGGRPRLGDVDPAEEPYRSEFERQRIEVFDLTKLKSPGDDAHDRAFQDITSVMTMIKVQQPSGQ